MIETMEDGDYPRLLSPLTKGPITQFVLEGKQVKSPPASLRSMYQGGRGREMEDSDFSMNPDPVPYQSSNFMAHRFDRLEYPDQNSPLSSTVLKKVPLPKRHLDTFGGYEYSVGGKRGVILHTDRYQWDASKSYDSALNLNFSNLSQRERLQLELEYMEKLRGIKRRREVLPHRANLDLLMGGKKVEFAERFDIQREIQKLKSLILPTHARDLFHGRGFTLPESHHSIKPRRPTQFDDVDDELSSFPPSKYSIDPETGRAKLKQPGTSLPKINGRGYMLGHGAPLILSKEKRLVEGIKARLRIPTRATKPAYLQRSKTNVQPAKHAPSQRSRTAVPTFMDQQAKQAAIAKNIRIPAPAPEPEPPGPDPPPSEQKQEIESDMEVESVKETESRRASRMSHHTRASPTKAPTPNPLKGSELTAHLSQEEQDHLKQTFQTLDTDKDGHILYNQLQTQLPEQFSVNQEKFIKQVYDITSSNTFFGVDEFMTMSFLTRTVTSIRGEALAAFDRLNFHSLHESIVQYVDLFQKVDKAHKGKISLEHLQDILTAALGKDMAADTEKWGKILDVLHIHEAGQISKIEYLASIPYFLTLQSGT